MRPKKCRRIDFDPGTLLYKPAGKPLHELELVEIGLDEFEALRLADREKLYQEEAAARMGISRATFGRLISSAHAKVAEALVTGKCLAIVGGNADGHIQALKPNC